MSDLIPWKKSKDMPLEQREDQDALLDMRNQMNRMFDDFFERPFELQPFGRSLISGDFSPRMDVSETDLEVTVSVELPGMDPEDIQVTIDRNTLAISGEKHAEKEEKGQHFYQVERSFGSFRRSISLPGGVDEKRIEATFKHGVLKVKLPKTEASKKETNRITIKSS
jgi:HSP20 family protein